jgi:Plasmid pRiA4b ORF-3-like protein
MRVESRRNSQNRRPPEAKPVALRIELLDVTPLVWRRIVVTNQWTFANLHQYLQWVMGWWDSHPHEFEVGDQVVAPDWWIEEVGLDREVANYRDEHRFSIAAAVSELGIRGEIEYRYDMGDDWRHRLVIEAPPPAWDENGLPLPGCIAGENACPPEDVGGPPGYQRFLETIGHRGSEEYVDMLRWIGGAFDPHGFDLNRLNRDWSSHRRRRR